MMGEVEKRYPVDGILPVIHLQSAHQAVQMAGVAKEAGASGVFIIDHKHSTMWEPENLAQAADWVKLAHPELWVGVNCLTLSPLKNVLNFAGLEQVDGIWTDNALNWYRIMDLTADNALRGYYYAESVARYRKAHPVVYFGGIAMKGSGYVEDPVLAADLVTINHRTVDVVTTSGPGTSKATPLEKVYAMRQRMGGGKLAVASGVNVANIRELVPDVNYFLVASSIEKSEGVFDEAGLANLVEAYREAELAKMCQQAEEERLAPSSS